MYPAMSGGDDSEVTDFPSPSKPVTGTHAHAHAHAHAVVTPTINAHAGSGAGVLSPTVQSPALLSATGSSRVSPTPLSAKAGASTERDEAIANLMARAAQSVHGGGGGGGGAGGAGAGGAVGSPVRDRSPEPSHVAAAGGGGGAGVSRAEMRGSVSIGVSPVTAHLENQSKLQRMFTSIKPNLLRAGSTTSSTASVSGSSSSSLKSPVGVAGIGAPVVVASAAPSAAPSGQTSAVNTPSAASAASTAPATPHGAGTGSMSERGFEATAAGGGAGAGGYPKRAPLQPSSAWANKPSHDHPSAAASQPSPHAHQPPAPPLQAHAPPQAHVPKRQKAQTPRSARASANQSFFYKRDEDDSEDEGYFARGGGLPAASSGRGNAAADAADDDDEEEARRERRRGTWQPDSGQLGLSTRSPPTSYHHQQSSPSHAHQPPSVTRGLSHERPSISGALNTSSLGSGGGGGGGGGGGAAGGGASGGSANHPSHRGAKHQSIIRNDLKSGSGGLLGEYSKQLQAIAAKNAAAAQAAAAQGSGANSAGRPLAVLNRLTSIPNRPTLLSASSGVDDADDGDGAATAGAGRGGHSHGSSGHGGHGHGGHGHDDADDAMTEDEFAASAAKLSPAELVTSMRQMFTSLKQMRRMLRDINSMPVDIDKHETFARIVSRIRSLVAAEHVLLFLAEGDYLVCTASTRPLGDDTTVQRGNGFVGWVAKHHQSLNMKADADSDPRALFEPILRTGVAFKSLLCVPIVNKNRQIVAVIQVVNKRATAPPAAAGARNSVTGASGTAAATAAAAKAGPGAAGPAGSTGGSGGSGAGSTPSSGSAGGSPSMQTHSVAAAASGGAGSAAGTPVSGSAGSAGSGGSGKAKKPHFTEQDQQIVEFMSTIAGHSIENSLLYDEAVTRRVQTETLLQVAELLAAEVNTDMVIQRVVEASYLLVNAERITLFMVDEKNDELVQKLARGNKKDALRLPLAKGIVGYVATMGKPVNAHDAQDDWRFDPDFDKLRGFEVRSILAVPVCDHLGKTVAVVEAVNKLGGGYGFSRDEEALLQSMAVSAGIVLRKSQLYEEAVMRRKQTEALLQITELMSAELGVTKVIQKIVMAAYMLVNADRIQLYMVDEQTHELVCEATKGVAGGGFRLPLGAGVPGHVALTGRVVNIADAQRDWRFDSAMDDKTRYTTRTVVAVPVKDFLGKTVAVVEATNKKGTGKGEVVEFSGDDETVLKSLAVTAGTVLRKATLFDEAITRRRQTEALLQITELMSAEIGSEKVMQRIIEASYTLVNAERITLFSVDPITKELVCKVSRDEKFVGVRMPYGHGIVGHVALTRRSLNIADAYRDPRFDPAADIKTGYKTRSILTVPVTDRKGGCVAVIQAVNKKLPDGEQKTHLTGSQQSTFTAEEVTILESMAVSAGIILHKSRLYDAAVFADRKSRALMQLVKAAAREGTIEVIINAIAKVAYDALNADRVTIYFVDPVKDEVWCIVCKDEPGWSLPMGKGIAGYVAKTGQKVNLRNAYEDVRFDPSWDLKTNYRTKTVLCVPVKDFQGQVIAVIQALNKKRAKIDLDNPANTYWKEADVIREEKDFIAQQSSVGQPNLKYTVAHGSAAARVAQQQTAVATTTGGGGGPGSGGSAGAGAAVATSLGGGGDDEVVPFSEEDEEILDAFCVEVRAVVRRHQTDALLEHSVTSVGGKKSDVAVSIIEMYNTQQNSARGKAAAAANAQSPQFVWPALEGSKLGKGVNDLDFNVWNHTPDDLLVITFEILQEMRLVDDFAIDPAKLKSFLYAVRRNYQDNPFHNWYHGFSVFHFAYLTLRMTNASSLLSTLDVLGLLLSSLCHDIDHPGNTNAYEVATDSKLALRHNDISVLENHHSVTTFEILRAPASAIFEKMPRDKYMALRKTIVAAILATDMSVHFESCKNLDTRELDTPFNAKIESERANIVKVLIHSADLSGQVFPTLIASQWEQRISREFELQANKEKARGLAVLSHMQNLHDPVVRAQNQVAFIDYVLTPWWRSVCRVFPGLKPCFDNLVANRKHYDLTAKALQAQGAINKPADKKTDVAAAATPAPAASAAAAAPAATAAAAPSPAPAPSASPAAAASASAPSSAAK